MLKLSTKQIFTILFKFVLTIGIISWLIYSNFDSCLVALNKIDFYYLIIPVILYLIIVTASAFRWYLFIRIQKINLSFSYILNLTARSFFFSLIIPLGAISGDIFKMGYLLKKCHKNDRLTILSTVIIDRLTGMIGLFIVGVCMFSLLFRDIAGMGFYIKNILYFILIINIIGIVATVIFFNHRLLEKTFFIKHLFQVGDKITKGFVSEILKVMDRYANSIKTLIYGITISIILGQSLSSLILCFIAIGIASSFFSFSSFLFAISFGNTAGFLPITPSGIGTRDMIVNKILIGLDYSQIDAIAVPIIYSAIILIGNIILGLSFFVPLENKDIKN